MYLTKTAQHIKMVQAARKLINAPASMTVLECLNKVKGMGKTWDGKKWV